MLSIILAPFVNTYKSVFEHLKLTKINQYVQSFNWLNIFHFWELLDFMIIS